MKASAPSSNEVEIKRETSFTVIIHAALVLILLSLLFCVMPPMAELFAGASHWPSSFLFLLQVSEVVRAWWFVTIPSLALLLWLDAHIYSSLLRKPGKIFAQSWSLGVFLALVGFWGLFIWAVFSPFWRMTYYKFLGL